MPEYEEYPITSGFQEVEVEYPHPPASAFVEEPSKWKRAKSWGGKAKEWAKEKAREVYEEEREEERGGSKAAYKFGRSVPGKIEAAGKYLAEPIEKTTYDKRGRKRTYTTTRLEEAGKATKGAISAWAPSLNKEERKALLFGRVRPGLYTGPTPSAQAMAPGMVPAGALHMMDLSGLRALGMPGNLRPVEQDAWKEIKMNGDIDTRNNVVRDLTSLGYSPSEASKAVTSLERKGHIEKTGQSYNGSPEYQITITVGGR